MAELMRQDQRLLAEPQGLLRVAKTPQAARIVRHGAEAGIHSVPQHEGLMVDLWPVKGQHVAELHAACSELPKAESHKPQPPVTQPHQQWITRFFSQAKYLFSQLTRLLILAAHIVQGRLLAQD